MYYRLSSEKVIKQTTVKKFKKNHFFLVKLLVLRVVFLIFLWNVKFLPLLKIARSPKIHLFLKVRKYFQPTWYILFGIYAIRDYFVLQQFLTFWKEEKMEENNLETEICVLCTYNIQNNNVYWFYLFFRSLV